MIDPYNVDYRAGNKNIVQEFWLYAFLVAGKKSTTIAPRLDGFLKYIQSEFPDHMCEISSPFETIEVFLVQSKFDQASTLKEWGFGQQKRTLRFFKDTINKYYSKMTDGIEHYEPSNWSIKEMESIYGVGMKTARFYALNTRWDVEAAAIDTHIIKFLKDEGVILSTTPNITPSSRKQYEEFEKLFLAIAHKRNMRPRELDQSVWNKYSQKEEIAA